MLTINILSCNRPELCIETVESVKKNSLKGCEIIISENSEGDSVYKILKKKFPNLKIINRNPQLPQDQHFNTLLKECKSEFLVTFHDDDLMDESYCKTLLHEMKTNKELAAVATNAEVILGSHFSKSLFIGDFNEDLIIEKAEQFLKPYLKLSNTHPAPLSGYMYRMSKVKNLRTDPIKGGGKHCDVTFALNLLKEGKFKWLSKRNMFYRIHKNNDSSSENIRDRIKLIIALRKYVRYPLLESDLQEYRYFCWLKFLKTEKGKFFFIRSFFEGWKSRLVLTYLFKRSFSLFFSSPDYRKLLFNFFFKKIKILKK